MVTIADKNDNTPYFEKLLYEKEVDEQPADSSKSILTVKARDIDDGKFQVRHQVILLVKSINAVLILFLYSYVADTLTYTITSGNTGNVFGIKPKTGDIYVAKDLDFETPPNVSRLATKSF